MRWLCAAILACFAAATLIAWDKSSVPVTQDVAVVATAPAPVAREPLPRADRTFVRPALTVRVAPRPARVPAAHPTSSKPRQALALPGTWLDVTAYCATGSATASGAWPHAGMAAGNRWPFGTRIYVPGYGTVVITDRIGWGSDLDIYLGDRADCAAAASSWGRRHLRVEVRR